MHLVSELLEQYINDHTSSLGGLMDELERQTWRDIMLPQMISGKVQGQFLKLISQIQKPSNILEIGTFTGYSALCLAQGLSQNGKIITIDINEELYDMANSFFQKSGLSNQIEYKIGDAKSIIPTINETFDIFFLDADKQNYSLYYDLVFEKVRPGGLILADNVLWSGRVIDTNPNKDTKALIDFNEKINKDNRVENVILSIRDGIMMIRKK
jgi:predicted O-methyltransferase YrrM